MIVMAADSRKRVLDRRKAFNCVQLSQITGVKIMVNSLRSNEGATGNKYHCVLGDDS